MSQEVSMKKLFILIIPLFLTALLPAATSAQTASGPKMVIEEKGFDFKEVQEGKIVEHAFKVLNEGNQLLQIRTVRPG
jgi:hypothetical protein